MQNHSFSKLHSLLRSKIKDQTSPPEDPANPNERKRAGNHINGPIGTAIRLSAAIRYFTGGDPLDIALVHGISHREVFYSVWAVVNAINQTKELDISFPTDHQEQRNIAKGFLAKSAAGFDNCVGAIDGLLIWIQKPSADECLIAQCGAKQFYCGHKHKFGLNLQGICDSQGRFLDISIGHPASASDYLAFITSPIWFKLEEPDFLAPGL